MTSSGKNHLEIDLENKQEMTSEMASLSSRWQNHNERPNQYTNNGDMDDIIP